MNDVRDSEKYRYGIVFCDVRKGKSMVAFNKPSTIVNYNCSDIFSSKSDFGVVIYDQRAFILRLTTGLKDISPSPSRYCYIC